MKDLRPYVCTYEGCREGDQLYDNFRQWVIHEITSHGASLSCMNLADTIFRSSSHYEDHIQSEHHIGSTSATQPSVSIQGYRQCPVCLEERVDWKHIGLHLQQIALFSLPRSTGFEAGSEQPSVGSERGTWESRTLDHHPSSSREDSIHVMDNTKGSFLSRDEEVLLTNTFIGAVEAVSPFDKNILWVKAEDQKPSETYSTMEAPKVSLTKDALNHAKATSERDPLLGVSEYLRQLDTHNPEHPDPANAAQFQAHPESSFQSDLQQNMLGLSGQSGVGSEVSNRNHGSGYASSFLFRIDHITPDFTRQPIQQFADGGWKPPTWGTGLTTAKYGRLYRWRSGTASAVAQNDAAYVRINGNPGDYQYRAATVFTQAPASQSFFGVEFDARYSNIDPDHQWEKLMFTHAHHPAGQGYYYSELGIQREYYQMATGTNSNWQQDLFPQQMHCPANTQNAANRHNAGLTGSLPLLLAVIAFSGPQQQLDTILQNCLRPPLHPATCRGTWQNIPGMEHGRKLQFT